MDRSRIAQFVWLPAILTFLVSLVRLAGELLGGSAVFFNTEAGGGGALVGISWLIPVFGIYFGWRLPREGLAPKSRGKAIGYPFLALLLAIALAVVNFSIFQPGSVPSLVIFSLICLVLTLVVKMGWEDLFWVLTTYAFAARVPVAVIMFLAIAGNWGTHYDAPPPDFPEMGWFAEWLITGLAPQLGFWIGFTVIAGAIFSGITLLVIGRRHS